MLEDSFSHDVVWLQPYGHLYVSLGSERSLGKEPDVDDDAEPAHQFDTEPAVEPEDLEPLPTPRLWLRSHTTLTQISMMLATRYQTCPPTPTTFPK